MGDPKPSEYPWPEPCVRGGGVMQPVQYKISANARCGQIIDILRHTASQLPDILSQMEIHVSYLITISLPCKTCKYGIIYIST